MSSITHCCGVEALSLRTKRCEEAPALQTDHSTPCCRRRMCVLDEPVFVGTVATNELKEGEYPNLHQL